MAFATEHPVLAHSEYRAVEDVERKGGRFEVVSHYAPAGDQPVAIAELHTINMDFTKRTAVSAADRRTSGKRLR